jgi:hypothetical protein
MDEVVLFYWPKKFVTRDICGSNGYGSATTSATLEGLEMAFIDAITFNGQDLHLLSTEIGGAVTPNLESMLTSTVVEGKWTFTSPTNYLAHRVVSASLMTFSMKGSAMAGWTQATVSKTIVSMGPASVITLGPNDLFIERPRHDNKAVTDGTSYAQLVAQGKFDPKTTGWDQFFGKNQYSARYTAHIPFDWAQIQEPVPASAYYDARHEDCWGKQSHCGTITEGAYRPRLSIRGALLSALLPKTWGCDIPAVVDPPIALHPMLGVSKPPPPELRKPPTAPSAAPDAVPTAEAKRPFGYMDGLRDGDPWDPGNTAAEYIPLLQPRPGDAVAPWRYPTATQSSGRSAQCTPGSRLSCWFQPDASSSGPTADSTRDHDPAFPGDRMKPRLDFGFGPSISGADGQPLPLYRGDNLGPGGDTRQFPAANSRTGRELGASQGSGNKHDSSSRVATKTTGGEGDFRSDETEDGSSQPPGSSGMGTKKKSDAVSSRAPDIAKAIFEMVSLGYLFWS